jgi:hypothetical protein
MHFKGREGASQLSQEPAIGPRPDPDEFSPHPPNPFLDIHFNTFTFKARSSFVVSFSSGFLSTIEQFCAAPHAQPIACSSI